MSAAVWLFAAALLPSGPETHARVDLPLATAARPTTLPKDLFGVYLDTRLRHQPPWWNLPLAVGAGYGVEDQLEVGIELIRLTFADGDDPEARDLTAPLVYGRGHVDLGPLELGGGVGLELPLSGFRALDGELFARLHFADLARLDLAGRLGGRFDDPTRALLDAEASATFSLHPRFALTVGGHLDSLRLFAETDLAVRPRAEAIFTVGDRNAPPLVDVALSFEGPATRLEGDVEGRSSFEIGLSVVLFFDDPVRDEHDFF